MRVSTRAGNSAVDFDRLLAPECTITNLIAASKKRALQRLADRLATRYPAFDADTVFEALMARERLGSTAVGEGVAIPHCRLAECDAPVAALAYLDAPVDFDAPDGREQTLVTRQQLQCDEGAARHEEPDGEHDRHDSSGP